MTCEALKSWFRTTGSAIPFPNDYISFDIETSGLDPFVDVIVQMGCVIVRDRKLVDVRSVYLNWPKSTALTNKCWLKARLQTVIERFAAAGKTFAATYPVLEKSGDDPLFVLTECSNILFNAMCKGQHILMHNGLAFDVGMLCHHFRRFLNTNFTFSSDAVIDTGILTKAAQLDISPEVGETPAEFGRRVRFTPGDGVTWSLDRYCVPTLLLDKAVGVVPAMMHDAGYDAYVTHLVFEKYRNFRNGEE